MEIMWDILASIYYGECSYDELCERDFLKTTSNYGISLCLNQLVKRNLVKEKKNGKYKATAEAKQELASRGYFA